MNPTDDDILQFRKSLTTLIESDPGRSWSFSGYAARLIDFCNRALGAPVHEGQVWRGAAGFGSVYTTNYKPCRESRDIVSIEMGWSILT